MWKFSLIFLLFLIVSPSVRAEEEDSAKVTIYLFPGQGADYRLFKNLEFPEGYDTIHISYPIPERAEDMRSFAKRFIPLIDRDQDFILLGVSLGGMLCTELADMLDPQKVIIISSAKTAAELPDRYTFMCRSRLNRIVPKRLVKFGARTLQGIVEPDRRYDKSTFKDMLKKKDPAYLKRSADMITCWNREQHQESIIHIHGDNDHTIPFENVNCSYVIEDGSHMMVLTRAGEISALISEVLHQSADFSNF